MSENWKVEDLDNSQFEAVFTKDPYVVVEAPAGSGKTHTAIYAIAHYREENPNDKVCFITFTRAAKAEMEARLAELNVPDIEVSTIHVWARARIEDLSRFYGFQIEIMDKPQIMMILDELLAKSNYKIKVKNEILYSYVTGNKKMDVTEEYRRTLNRYNEKYIDYKRNNNLYDFTDYPLYLYDKLVEYSEIINDIDALYVDELQDVDAEQSKVFDLVKSKKKFYIGDKKQCIYGFRGASEEVFEHLRDNFEWYGLKYNYRSYQEIIDYAGTVYARVQGYLRKGIESATISTIKKMEPVSIKCVRGKGANIAVMNRFGQTIDIITGKEVDSVDRARTFLRKQPMILCPTNKQVKSIEELGYYKVSTIHQAKGLEYDNVIVIDKEIDDQEVLNVSYVAMTRARDGLFVVNYPIFYTIIKELKRKGDIL